VAVRNLLLGVDVTQGEALLRLRGASAEIERFTLRGGDGRLDVTGGATWQQAGQAPAARRPSASACSAGSTASSSPAAALELDAGGDQPRCDGRLHVDEGLFDLTPQRRAVAGRRRHGAPARRGRRGEADGGRRRRPRRGARSGGLELDLGERLRVRGRGLDTDLGGKLRWATPGGQLAVHGTVTAAGGTYAAYGQKLTIERGIVAFSGPPDNPRLDVLALRPDLDNRRSACSSPATLHTARAAVFRTRLTDSDKLSWLVLGRAPTAWAAPTPRCCSAPRWRCWPAKARRPPTRCCATSASTS
jgi:translocation and assembly module TamB